MPVCYNGLLTFFIQLYSFNVRNIACLLFIHSMYISIHLQFIFLCMTRNVEFNFKPLEMPSLMNSRHLMAAYTGHAVRTPHIVLSVRNLHCRPLMDPVHILNNLCIEFLNLMLCITTAKTSKTWHS